MFVDRVHSLINEDLKAVNQLILEKIQSEVDLITDLSHHILNSGGKRLRPALVLLSSKACGYKGTAHITLAASIEFFHTATLLHDDVVDDSTLRRGRDTANCIWGSKASILVGDYLFTHFMQLMVDIGIPEILQLLTDTAHETSCGEIRQLVSTHDSDLTMDYYFNTIRAKTAVLFAASAAIGPIISGCSEDLKKALHDYGLHLGNAFQLIDDALDYCSDSQTIGKNIGDDLAEGKVTLPLIHALKHGTELQKIQIKDSLQRGTLEFLPEILIALKETQAIEFTKTIAAQEVDSALSSLTALEDSEYKTALIDLAHLSISRLY